MIKYTTEQLREALLKRYLYCQKTGEFYNRDTKRIQIANTHEYKFVMSCTKRRGKSFDIDFYNRFMSFKSKPK